MCGNESVMMFCAERALLDKCHKRKEVFCHPPTSWEPRSETSIMRNDECFLEPRHCHCSVGEISAVNSLSAFVKLPLSRKVTHDFEILCGFKRFIQNVKMLATHFCNGNVIIPHPTSGNQVSEHDVTISYGRFHSQS
jgi:hypothetical protein